MRYKHSDKVTACFMLAVIAALVAMVACNPPMSTPEPEPASAAMYEATVDRLCDLPQPDPGAAGTITVVYLRDESTNKCTPVIIEK